MTVAAATGDEATEGAEFFDSSRPMVRPIAPSRIAETTPMIANGTSSGRAGCAAAGVAVSKG